ncbi:hypothetical protein VTK56DRAFT_3380 [Thermocarpiscus australiensis]
MSSQTPGGPSAKRRRVEAANATLRKPFRSPLISRRQQDQDQDQDQARNQNQSGPGPDSVQDSPSINHAASAPGINPRSPVITPKPTRGVRPSTFTPSTASPLHTSPSLAIPKTRTRPSLRSNRSLHTATGTSTGDSSSKGQTNKNNTEEESSDDDLLQRMRAAQRRMDAQVRAMQKRLELVRQARRIEQASRARRRPGGEEGEEQQEEQQEKEVEVDAEMRELVGKWKAASRVAAEELYGLVRARVEGMGGGGRAWGESRRRWGFGFGCSGGFGLGGEEEEGEEREDDRGDDEGEEAEEEESEQSGFTMLMMLKSLNIDPDVLGYDPVEDKWRD